MIPSFGAMMFRGQTSKWQESVSQLSKEKKQGEGVHVQNMFQSDFLGHVHQMQHRAVGSKPRTFFLSLRGVVVGRLRKNDTSKCVATTD